MSGQHISSRASVPPHIERDLAHDGFYVASEGEGASFWLRLDLASGLTEGSWSRGSRRHSSALELGPEELAQAVRLAKRAWDERTESWGHPQTVSGDETLAIVRGEQACFHQARGGWFTSRSARALVDWARSLLEARHGSPEGGDT